MTHSNAQGVTAPANRNIHRITVIPHNGRWIARYSDVAAPHLIDWPGTRDFDTGLTIDCHNRVVRALVAAQNPGIAVEIAAQEWAS